MFVFDYSLAWATLVTSQLRARFGNPPSTWGYACLCVGRELDDVVEKNYDKVDGLTGEFFHVFSLRAPPRALILARLARLASAPTAGEHDLARVLEGRLSRVYPEQARQQEEKERLLQDLREAGLDVNRYADFLFFDFRQQDDDIDVDVIAAKAAPWKDEQSAMRLFEKLGAKARTAAAKGQSAAEFVERTTWLWHESVALRKTMALSKYIADFLKLATGR